MKVEMPNWLIGAILAVVVVVIGAIAYNVAATPTAKLRTSEDMAKQHRSAPPPPPAPIPGK